MNFQEMVDTVAVDTKRPDQGELISLKLREATLWAHLKDFWRRDIQEKVLNFVSDTTPLGAWKGQVLQDCDLPKVRKISYWRKFDPNTCCAGAYLKPVEPDNLFDTFNRQKTDRYYLSGKVINWISCTQDKAHIVGYWAYPNINIAGYDSWIADQQPFAITNYAASLVFGKIGQQDESKKSLAIALEQLAELAINEVESQGR